MKLTAPADQHRADGPGHARPVNGAHGSGVDPDLFRSVMRHHAKGVSIVTAGGDSPVGFCATSLSSISLNPPLVSFTVGLHSASWTIVKTADHVMVHLLAEDQGEIAHAFARAGAPKFDPPTRWHRGPLGLPMLDDVLAWLLVAPVTWLPVADHALVVGEVTAAGHMIDGAPLVHHNSGFTRLEPARVTTQTMMT